MKGSVSINGVDLAELGVFILKGGDYDFLTFPERKEPTSNNWYEYDGLDIDLSEVYFKERNLSIQFYISNVNSKDYEENLNLFYQLISTQYIDLYSREFERNFHLRYLSVTDYKHKGGLYKEGNKQGWITISFSMDDPIQLFKDASIRLPSSSFKNETHISLNDVDLGGFGIVVNETYSSMLKLSAVKPPLTRSFTRCSGLLAYPSNAPSFEVQELTIKCTMRAKNRTEFYHNYEALFNNLSKPDTLQVESYLGKFDCYYSRMEEFKKMRVFKDWVLVSFTLKLVQIDAGITTFVLGAEDASVFVTESGEYIEITR